MRHKHPEYLTEEGAYALVDRLQAFWHGRGRPEFMAWIKEESVDDGKKRQLIYTVHSNLSALLRGLP
jgi:hypothetical protein